MPHFENMDATRGPPVLSQNLMRNIGNRDQLAWKHVELIRRRWNGRLVVKGMIAPADARIARESGADGVIVSNHGGRQLDGTVSPLRTLPEIAGEADGMTVMLDGGIRRGTDVLKALALGASSCFVGRPLLYAAVAAGEPGVQRAIGAASRGGRIATWRCWASAALARYRRSWCGSFEAFAGRAKAHLRRVRDLSPAIRMVGPLALFPPSGSFNPSAGPRAVPASALLCGRLACRSQDRD